MKELQVFENPEFGKVRAVEVEEEPWFVGKDVARALGYSDTKSAVSDHVYQEDRQIIQRGQNATFEIPTRGLTIINESGLYSLVLSSKIPGAKKFKRWVTSEILPSIRRNGGYIHGQETLSDEELMAKALLAAKRTIAAREERINTLEIHNATLTVSNQVMQPKADYFDELVERGTLTNFRETAKQLEVKERGLIHFLLEHKYIYRDKKGKLLPYAGKGDGLFEVKECYNEKTQWSGTQTLVTPKGRETFRLLYVGAQ